MPQNTMRTLLLLVSFIMSATLSAHAQSCTFSSTLRECGWEERRPHDSSVDWVIEQESSDRDSSRADGSYASSTFGLFAHRRAGVAFLQSPFISRQHHCVSFWYRTNAWRSGKPAKFTVLQSFGSRGSQPRNRTLLETAIGPGDGNQWLYRQLAIEDATDEYSVVFEIDSGETFYGYVHLDAVRLGPEAHCRQEVSDAYQPLYGNCEGSYLSEFARPAGCSRCSREECRLLCDVRSKCAGFSWAQTMPEYHPYNLQCYLKKRSCRVPVYNLPYTYFAKTTFVDTFDSNSRTVPPPPVRPPPTISTTTRRIWRTAPVTPAPMSRRPAATVPPRATVAPHFLGTRYNRLTGNCHGGFISEGGRRIGCSGCPLMYCQQLCDGRTECLGVSYTERVDIEPKCLLKILASCHPAANNQGYTYYTKA